MKAPLSRGAALVRSDAIALPFADDSVDLIVTSPPYFALRSYQDGGEHYDGQIGSEASPRAFLEALWAVTAECKRVLKPSGSIFVNLGDKYAGSGGHNNSNIAKVSGDSEATRRSAPDRYNQTTDVRAKSLMGLPWMYANGCTGALAGLGGADPGLDLILRAEIVWNKPNGLPESVTDRPRRSHEQWFQFSKSGSYFAAMDEVREPQSQFIAAAPGARRHVGGGDDMRSGAFSKDGGFNDARNTNGIAYNPLGKLPGSVWTIPSEPLQVPAHLNVDHFAAFPQEWPRRFILGWSPSGICIACGEPRRPVATKELVGGTPFTGRDYRRLANGANGGAERPMPGGSNEVTITGYACACDDTSAPTRPAVVLDPFGGTGTVAMVARALGRFGVSVDLSADYLRLANWRIFQSGHAQKAVDRTNREAQTVLDLGGNPDRERVVEVDGEVA